MAGDHWISDMKLASSLKGRPLTWTKTVKKMTVIMAVRNISLMGKWSLFSRKPREKAMAPLRPPYAMIN